MTATHEPHDRQYPGREEMFALVDGLGPSTLFDLFEEHEVPEDDRFGLIEEVLGLLVVHGRPVENLPAWFVETLERRCRAFTVAREDGEPVPEEASGFALVGRVEYLCHANQEEVFREPRRAVELAERAVELADGIDPTVCGEDVAAEQRILARAWLGNARRVASDLNGADHAFEESLRLLGESAPAQTIEAHVLRLLGSLRTDQGRYDEGRRVLQRAMAIASRLELGGIRLTVTLKLANLECYSGYAERGVEILQDALRTVDDTIDSSLYLYAEHNLTYLLVDAGRPLEALKHFEEANCQHEERWRAPLLQLRRRWLEGRIQAALGKLDHARSAFEEVRTTAIERELAYEQCVLGLELALVYLRQGDFRRVQELAGEMSVYFRSHRLRQHLMAAMHLFQRAAQTETITVRLVEEIRVYFQRSWNNPQARFIPSDGDSAP